MNKKIANSVSSYIESLYYLNQKLLKLCGNDIMYDIHSDFEKIVLDIVQEIPRLIPYSCNYEKKELEYKEWDGLLEFKNELNFLTNDYNNILLNNYDFLDKVRIIRNTYTHKMHGVEYEYSGGGSLTLFDVGFMVDRKSIHLYSGDFLKLFKELNILFSKIVDDVRRWAYQNNKEDYLYYQRITRFDFKDFNKIYESELLRVFGKVLHQF